ncbi:MAG TPA: hypothetical protein VGR07_13635 [Thermoanaerobaculia bacterium]|jgi:hypothetical protein|nr:hypothetical protein [Thermoanaerobaculia bacterium]
MGTVLAFAVPALPPGELLMEPAVTPGDLVRRIAAGDRRAEQEMVELYGEGLAFLLRRWTRDRDAADDLYQETLRLALEKIRRGEVRDPDRLPGFLRWRPRRQGRPYMPRGSASSSGWPGMAGGWASLPPCSSRSSRAGSSSSRGSCGASGSRPAPPRRCRPRPWRPRRRERRSPPSATG